jgi:hypothetical protein
MKIIFKNFFYALFIMNSFAVLAQDELLIKDFDANSLIAKELLLSNNKINIESTQNTNQFLLNNNLINVQQVGNFNYSSIYVQSREANLQVNQYGDNNYADVYRNAYELNETINQNGNNNFISDYSVYSDEAVNTTFNQNGDNLTIISNGSNSISKNLQINQTGNSGTIYIYNK